MFQVVLVLQGPPGQGNAGGTGSVGSPGAGGGGGGAAAAGTNAQVLLQGPSPNQVQQVEQVVPGGAGATSGNFRSFCYKFAGGGGGGGAKQVAAGSGGAGGGGNR